MILWIRYLPSNVRTGVGEFGSRHPNKNQAMWPATRNLSAQETENTGGPRGKLAIWTSRIHKLLVE